MFLRSIALFAAFVYGSENDVREFVDLEDWFILDECYLPNYDIADWKQCCELNLEEAALNATTASGNCTTYYVPSDPCFTRIDNVFRVDSDLRIQGTPYNLCCQAECYDPVTCKSIYCDEDIDENYNVLGWTWEWVILVIILVLVPFLIFMGLVCCGVCSGILCCKHMKKKKKSKNAEVEAFNNRSFEKPGAAPKRSSSSDMEIVIVN